MNTDLVHNPVIHLFSMTMFSYCLCPFDQLMNTKDHT